MLQFVAVVIVCILAFIDYLLPSSPDNVLGGCDDYDKLQRIISHYDKFSKSHSLQFQRENINQRVELHRKHFIWGYPAPATVKQLAKFINNKSAGVISIGAGSGAWECLLSHDINKPLYAIDNKPHESVFMHVDKIDVNSDEFDEYVGAKNTTIDTLFTCWPDLDSDMVVTAAEKIKPKYIIYIGENRGGCTGSDKMFDMFDKMKKIKTVSYRQWGGMFDECVIYETDW